MHYYLAMRPFVIFAKFDLEISLVCQTWADVKEGREEKPWFCCYLLKAVQILPSNA